MAKSRSKTITLPDVLPVLPICETVVYTMAITPLLVGHERSIRLVEDVITVNRFVTLVTQREATVQAAGRMIFMKSAPWRSFTRHRKLNGYNPPSLLDRMDVTMLCGYADAEKVHIARR